MHGIDYVVNERMLGQTW